MNKYIELADLIFPDIKETISDLENKYPVREIDEKAIVTRFAPSPTGFLHTGSLFASLVGYRFAKQTNGIFYIRLEDTDQKREIEGSGVSLLNELASFKIFPDEGYLGDKEKGNYGPYKQSERENIYKVVIKELIKENIVYPCFCSQEDLVDLRNHQESLKENPGYYGKYAKCSTLTPDEAIEKIKNGLPYVLRFRSKGNYVNKVAITDLIRGNLELSENDQHIVVLKSDGLPTYHFAHLVDDHFMRTTHVIRGEEWLPSLPIHIELFNTLNWKLPNYAHLPVVMKLDEGKRRKLSKRKDPEAAVSFFLEQGYPIDGFIEYLLTIANSNYEEWRTNNMNLNMFDFELSFSKMTLDGALFDLSKVKNICKDRLSRLNKSEFTKQALEYASKYNQELYNLINSDINYFKEIINIEREKENPRKDYEKFSDILPIINYFYDDYFNKMDYEPFNENISKEDINKILKDFISNSGLDLDEEGWFENLKQIASNNGFAANIKEYKKNKESFKGHIGDVSEIVRIAISKKKNTPNLYYSLKILGSEKVVKRIEKILN